MGFQDFLIDAKNILLGKADEENTIDFKEEIKNCVKSGLISEAEAIKIMETYNNQKKEGKKFDQKQISTISLEDDSEISEEEAKKRKKEKELERRKQENQRVANENSRKNNETNLRKPNAEMKKQNKSGKLTVDRNKLNRIIKNDELSEKNSKNLKERGEDN